MSPRTKVKFTLSLLGLLGLIVLGRAWLRDDSAKPGLEDRRWTVERVIDGDTIRVRDADPPRRMLRSVRLLNIDTPERGEPGREDATAHLQKLVSGQTLTLRFLKPARHDEDRYKRLLAYVFVESTNVNVEMVRAGWTRYDTRYGRGRFASSFEQAESEARRNRRGRW